MTRQKLIGALMADGHNYAWALAVVNSVLDEHAHELAEKIRNSKELRDLTDDHMHDVNAAANLIDPQKEGQ